jgi:hypothetical protein
VNQDTEGGGEGGEEGEEECKTLFSCYVVTISIIFKRRVFLLMT